MVYSTIIQKKCKCGCGKSKTLGYAGYNYACAPEEVKENVQSKTRKQIKQARQRLQNKVLKLANVITLNEVVELELWYKMQMQANDKYCQNCGISLHHLNDWAWRGSQHHCLEKSLFPSVATNPINHLVLGYYCCHSQFHTSMLNASKMPIFKKAKEIAKILYPLLPQDEKRRISEYYEIK